ncbi:MAG: hypothetical protein IKM36_07260, partial [Oscillospiraceae bacterium]|nr:hypothetical protein [Oscillospiraceae bacterium]
MYRTKKCEFRAEISSFCPKNGFGKRLIFFPKQQKALKTHFASSQSTLSFGAFEKAPSARSLAPPFHKRFATFCGCHSRQKKTVLVLQKKRRLAHHWRCERSFAARKDRTDCAISFAAASADLAEVHTVFQRRLGCNKFAPAQAREWLLCSSAWFASAAAALGAEAIQISHAGDRRMHQRIDCVFSFGHPKPFSFCKKKEKRVGKRPLFLGIAKRDQDPFSFVAPKENGSCTPKEKALWRNVGDAEKPYGARRLTRLCVMLRCRF